jgi:hypothetical protein
MKLYCIRRAEIDVGYDETAAIVVAAMSPKAAWRFFPTYNDQFPQTITLIGTAHKSLKAGIVLTDFRAG